MAVQAKNQFEEARRVPVSNKKLQNLMQTIEKSKRIFVQTGISEVKCCSAYSEFFLIKLMEG